MDKYYTGVGSRGTPSNILATMIDIAIILYNLGWTVRSGAAEGADTAFENGSRAAFNHDTDESRINYQEIYIPWNSFNNHYYNGYTIPFAPSYILNQKAANIIKEIHPNPYALSVGDWKLHSRNCYQVLGKDLNTPSQFLICWTKDGQPIGGTRTTIKLAERYNIPVWNLGDERIYNLISSWVRIINDSRH